MHCASHWLNLIVNDLNQVPQVRNATGTVKSVIGYIRDSAHRRNLFPKVPLLSETRCTSKYKSIRLFFENVKEIHEKLEELSLTLTSKARERAHELICAMNNSSFIVSLVIIAKYSADLEPVTQSLQAVNMDICKVREHVSKITTVFEMHRENAEAEFTLLFDKAKDIADSFGVNLTVPRLSAKMRHRANFDTEQPEDYFRVTIFIPYIDSLLSSLRARFCESNSFFEALSRLVPAEMSKLSKEKYMTSMQSISDFYEIENFVGEASTWYDMKTSEQGKEEASAIDLLDSAEFFPGVKQALLAYVTLPATTCTVERSFSTLRKVKTWLRSTMSDDRLSSLCMISVHREQIMKNKDKFIDDVIDKFGADRRRLQFLFSDNS